MTTKVAYHPTKNAVIVMDEGKNTSKSLQGTQARCVAH